MADGNFKDLSRITDSDKVLCNKALKLQAIYNMNDNKEALLHCSKIVMTNISGNGVTSKLMIYLFQINMVNYKTQSLENFKDVRYIHLNILGVDLADL